jgi:hypothetical protein
MSSFLSHHMHLIVTHAALLLSWPYATAMFAGILEYCVEARLFPQVKQQLLVSYTGLGLVVAGEALRKLAMVSSGVAIQPAPVGLSAALSGSEFVCHALMKPPSSSHHSKGGSCSVASACLSF